MGRCGRSWGHQGGFAVVTIARAYGTRSHMLRWYGLAHSQLQHQLSALCSFLVFDSYVSPLLLQVPSFAAISKNESLLGPPNISGNMLPLRILPLERIVKSPEQLHKEMDRYKSSKYMLAYLPGEHVPWWHAERWLHHYRTDPHIGVSLAQGASARDVLTAVLEAAHLRKAVAEQLRGECAANGGSCCSSNGSGSSRGGDGEEGTSTSSSSSSRMVGGCGGSSLGSSSGTRQRQQQQEQEDHHHHGLHQQQQQRHGEKGHSHRANWHIEQLSDNIVEPHRRKAKREAEKVVDRFIRDVSSAGWQTKSFLLSKMEKEGYMRLE